MGMPSSRAIGLMLAASTSAMQYPAVLRRTDNAPFTAFLMEQDVPEAFLVHQNRPCSTAHGNIGRVPFTTL